MGTRSTVTFDCERPATLAAFWSMALSYVEPSPPEGFLRPGANFYFWHYLGKVLSPQPGIFADAR